MKRKHRATYEALFAEPIRRNIDWNDVVVVSKSIGRRGTAGGSPFRLEWDFIQYPLTSSTEITERYQVKAVRDFLMNAGIEP
jgi:hypothetical protein